MNTMTQLVFSSRDQKGGHYPFELQLFSTGPVYMLIGRGYDGGRLLEITSNHQYGKIFPEGKFWVMYKAETFLSGAGGGYYENSVRCVCFHYHRVRGLARKNELTFFLCSLGGGKQDDNGKKFNQLPRKLLREVIEITAIKNSVQPRILF